MQSNCLQSSILIKLFERNKYKKICVTCKLNLWIITLLKVCIILFIIYVIARATPLLFLNMNYMYLSSNYHQRTAIIVSFHSGHIAKQKNNNWILTLTSVGLIIDLIVDRKISTEGASSQSMMGSKREQSNNPPDNFRCCFRRRVRCYCSLFDPIMHFGFCLR